jgi:hypothetical protein
MALNADGGGGITIVTYPGSGDKYSETSTTKFSRIKVLTYNNIIGSPPSPSNWVPSGRTDIVAPTNNDSITIAGSGSAATDDINPATFNSTKGWNNRRQTINYLNSTSFPNLLGNNSRYKIETNIYWQGSEAGSCDGMSGNLPALGTGATLSSFNGAVAASAASPSAMQNPCTSTPDVYCTYDIWLIHVQVITDQPTAVSCPIMLTIFDDITGKVLNTQGRFGFT